MSGVGRVGACISNAIISIAFKTRSTRAHTLGHPFKRTLFRSESTEFIEAIAHPPAKWPVRALPDRTRLELRTAVWGGGGGLSNVATISTIQLKHERTSHPHTQSQRNTCSGVCVCVCAVPLAKCKLVRDGKRRPAKLNHITYVLGVRTMCMQMCLCGCVCVRLRVCVCVLVNSIQRRGVILIGSFSLF